MREQTLNFSILVSSFNCAGIQNQSYLGSIQEGQLIRTCKILIVSNKFMHRHLSFLKHLKVYQRLYKFLQVLTN